MHRLHPVVLVTILALACVRPPGQSGRRDGPIVDELPTSVSLTWLSVTGWLLRAGETTVILDGYVGRVDRTTIDAEGGSSAPARPDAEMVRRVGDAILRAGEPDWVLVGHGHWDHALDAPAWAERGGRRIVGSRTACLQARAFGMAADRCTAVGGGETLRLGEHVRVRAVRWHHSGDSSTVAGRRLRAPLGLERVPELVDGGLRPGFLEDYPNGAGSIAYLFSVRTDEGPVTILWSNTGNPQLWESPAPVDSAFFRENGIPTEGLGWRPARRPTRASLTAAAAAEGLSAVDVWLGLGNVDHVRQVASVLPPRAFVPHHWDDFWGPLLQGVDRAYPGTALPDYAAEAGMDLVVPTQYFDRFEVTVDGVRAVGDRGARADLGVPDPPAR